MEIRDWLVGWFANKLNCSKKDIDVYANFFENGYVDSLKIFELIIEIESYFNIKFDNDDFLDEKTHTIMGLEKLIKSKLSEHLQ